MSSDTKQNIIVVVVITAIVAAVVGGGSVIVLNMLVNPPEGEEDILELYHWWTSGGERDALDALLEVFTDEYNVTVVESPVTGGAGFNMLAVIKSLVLAGEAPDGFQMHAGYEGYPYFEAGLLDDIDSLWESEGFEDVIPDVVQSMCQFEGHFYSVPVNIHRSNVLWCNAVNLSSAGIDPSEDLDTWDEFFTACDTIKSSLSIDYPVTMGEDWTQAHAFESFIAAEGLDVYEKWINGEITDENDPDLLSALDNFEKFLSYVDPDDLSLTWNDATAKVINGEAVFNLMGDWANGEFYVAGAVYGETGDYITVTAPGTAGQYGLVIDCFQHPKNVKHPQTSLEWLKVVGSKKGQDAFNPIKGSISARTDSNVSKYQAYHKNHAIPDFTSNTTKMWPSVVHGSGMPESYRTELKNVISDFTSGTKTKAQTAKILADLAADNADDFTQTWDLGT